MTCDFHHARIDEEECQMCLLQKRLDCLIDCCNSAIKAGDWKVDGACDPGFWLEDWRSETTNA